MGRIDLFGGPVHHDIEEVGKLLGDRGKYRGVEDE